ncbi:ribonuclease HII [Salinicoccus halodurans]|uniref:Ribonuclease HII n=1 Tax=Salinicoccus halodurans TaxID=407035 RepID=A0A0F7HJD1_9STAP|nr:ribonuclease HII [Salinicoccus halodurans]AKG73771.1 ribonuclease HII [Salinicoccus halodurans]SFK55624.1 RNase HII [Salinicoccus halodurans]
MKSVWEIAEEIARLGTLEEIEKCGYGADARKGVVNAIEKQKRRIAKEQKLLDKYEKMSSYEQNLKPGCRYIAGVDEAGRGPIAGEVVAAAVILPDGFLLPGLDDSKKLSLEKREAFREIIMREADYGIGIASVEEIDKLNIYEASKLAMRRAVDNLNLTPGHLLVDAMTIDMGIDETPIIKGDANSVSIAAASVIAKTTRDMMMKDYDAQYPGYHFSNHKGYGTREHLAGLEKYGVLPVHRKTFEPVKSLILKQ